MAAATVDTRISSMSPEALKARLNGPVELGDGSFVRRPIMNRIPLDSTPASGADTAFAPTPSAQVPTLS